MIYEDTYKTNNKRKSICIQCQREFKEHIVNTALAESHRYCSKYTIKRNLRPVERTKDMHSDKSKNLIELTSVIIHILTTRLRKNNFNEIRGQLCTNFDKIQKNFWTSKYFFINLKLMEKFYGTYL